MTLTSGAPLVRKCTLSRSPRRAAERTGLAGASRGTVLTPWSPGRVAQPVFTLRKAVSSSGLPNGLSSALHCGGLGQAVVHSWTSGQFINLLWSGPVGCTLLCDEFDPVVVYSWANGEFINRFWSCDEFGSGGVHKLLVPVDYALPDTLMRRSRW